MCRKIAVFGVRAEILLSRDKVSLESRARPFLGSVQKYKFLETYSPLSCWARSRCHTNTFSLPLAQTTMTGSVYLTISLTGGWERSIMIQCIIFNITIKWGREPLGCGRGGPNICRKRILKWVLIRKPSVWPWVLLTSCIWYFFGGLPSQRRHSQWGSCSRADRFPVRVSGLGTLTSSD